MMAAWNSSNWAILAFRNVFLVAFSVFFLPLDLYILSSAYVLQVLLPLRDERREARRVSGFTPRKVLITGIGTTKGVAMARMFYKAGHDVIAAETMTGYVSPWGRFSRSVKKFYPLPHPTTPLDSSKVRSESYFNVVRWIVREEKIAFWISCSEGVPAVFDAELSEVIARDTLCKPILFDEHTTKALSNIDTLVEYLESVGLPAPPAHSVSSREQIHQVLTRATSPAPKPYIIRKPNDAIMRTSVEGRMRLPKRTISETYEAVAQVPINATNPYVLQQEVSGKQYNTHALIIANEVRSFAAIELGPSMSYESLPADGVLTQAMLQYTQEFARRSRGQLTGHVSFTFVVDEHATEKGSVQLLFAIDCKPRVTTACILLNNRQKQLVNYYLQAGSKLLANGVSSNRQPPITPQPVQRFYWIGYDLSTLVFRSIFMLLTWQVSIGSCVANLATFVQHVLFWKEATFEIWDPMPSFWLYHVYWPAQLLGSILAKRKVAQR